MTDAFISRDCAEHLSNNKPWLDELSGGLPENFNFRLVGSVADAKALILTLPNCDRGRAALGLYRHHGRIGTAIAYAGVMVAWDHDHREVVDAFGSSDAFVAALKKIAPALGPAVPGRLEVWRGAIIGRNDGLQISIGPSWTRSRNVASWFALHDYTPALQPTLAPIVLHANIDRSIIVATHGARAEQEVIIDVGRPELVGRGVITLDADNSLAEPGRQLDVPCSDDTTLKHLIASWRIAAARYERHKRALELRRQRARHSSDMTT
jgi:hypothetical protein